MFYVINKPGFISGILGRTRRGEKGWMRTSGIAGRYGRENHFEIKKIMKYNKYEENGKQIIRKYEILKQIFVLDRKQTGKQKYDSRRAFVVQSYTKRPKVENMERRPVIIKHRTQRRRTSRIAWRPARDVWKHELCEANGKQIIRKCEILKQMTTEARKRIKNLGNMKKGHPKSRDVSNGSAATRRAESQACGDFRFKYKNNK